MSAKPKHDLSGATGNMQDVSDLQQMLANLQMAHEAAIDQMSILEAERTELRNKVEELEDDVKSKSALHEAAMVQLRGTQVDLERMKLSGGKADPQSIRELCGVRRSLRAGRVSDAIGDLERALNHIFPGWRVWA